MFATLLYSATLREIDLQGSEASEQSCIFAVSIEGCHKFKLRASAGTGPHLSPDGLKALARRTRRISGSTGTLSHRHSNLAP